MPSQRCWHTPGILALRSKRQEYPHKFKVSLVYKFQANQGYIEKHASFLKSIGSQAWWYVPLIPRLRKQRQVDL